MRSNVRIVWVVAFALVTVVLLVLGNSRPVDSPTDSPRLVDSSRPPTGPTASHELEEGIPAVLNAKSANIDFGEFGLVNVVFRDPPAHVGKLPISLAEKIADLEHQANLGSVRAAILLHRGLNHCQSFPYKTKETFDEAINTLHETQKFTIISHGQEVQIDANPSDLKNLSESFTFCEGITSEQEKTQLEWLKLAAELGDAETASDLGRKWLGNTTEGRSYLEKAWQSGWYPAARTLAKFNAGVVLTFPDSIQPAEDVANDRVASYAYLYLYAYLLEADGQLSDKFVHQAQGDLKAIGDQLSPHELRESTQLAAEMLRANSGCCYSRLPSAIASNRASPAK